jgi:LysM repeat protein
VSARTKEAPVRRAFAVPLASLAFAVAAANATPTYHVHAGDTLSAIALRFDTTVGRLERLNRLPSAAALQAGATLQLPGAPVRWQSYRIVAGDTLSAIAQRFHTTAERLAAANSVDPTRPILAGATLRVPKPTVSPRLPGAARTLRVYRVRAGDTLSAIALRAGVSLGELATINHLELNRPLLIGQRLELPVNGIAEALAPESAPVRYSLRRWAAHYGVDPKLATALAWMESGFNNTLVSSAGAVGVMQITPQTWSYVQHILLLGAPVPHTPDGNVRIGVAYLHHLLHLYSGDIKRALAAYYQGARSLALNGFLPGTGQYIADILALRGRF